MATITAVTSRFGLGIFPAGGGPAGRRWIGDFPGRRRSGRDGVGLGIFRDFSRYAVTDIRNFQWYAVTDIRAVSAGSSGFGFQLYRTFFYRIPVVPHIL